MAELYKSKSVRPQMSTLLRCFQKCYQHNWQKKPKTIRVRVVWCFTETQSLTPWGGNSERKNTFKGSNLEELVARLRFSTMRQEGKKASGYIFSHSAAACKRKTMATELAENSRKVWNWQYGDFFFNRKLHLKLFQLIRQKGGSFISPWDTMK